mmetsp:Transcript_6942/g.15830  ORF Transcript_6942/g.15830 Transcript_6942/m.15830 type:complete len:220 (+) Transcript_6942:193-852(+)|eukprot:CAMPEP_0206487928 /NCGR_PEP_ID=MMETSP0324_2-20121206/42016_1 /ASSEMBLY_ACC=CAM_ASM_000836 /TAXON_ID=2866 /ORGANISM="Crypthecodinium cohnii, Strain Seligo" /LENGTH=219 /DNA_ID=CAMNT_0053966669 /DNA_START=132 /DNA_END=791 /DNA_ORIENTATION=+
MPLFNLFGSANTQEAREESSKEMVRSWQRKIRAEGRDMERQIQRIEREEEKMKKDITNMAAQGSDPANIKILAKSVVRSRKARNRLWTMRATMKTVESQLTCAAANMRLKDSMQGSAEVMKEINKLMNVENVQENLQAMTKEMMKAGLIEEMMDEGMEALDGPDIEEEAEEELDKVLEDLAIDATIRTAVLRPEATPAVAAPATAAPAASSRAAASATG